MIRKDRDETVLIAGAGMVGLGAALAFANGKRKITILERDPAPPAMALENVFEQWERRGVAQLRHSHIFLGRLVKLLRQQCPSLLMELYAAGARFLPFKETLPPALRERYRPQPGDDDLTMLYCRRATLEFVMRRHVERLPGVTIQTATRVEGLVSHREGQSLVVTGLRCERENKSKEFHADIVIDATGRTSRFPNWLRNEGVVVKEERRPANLLYFTRHYRLKDGAAEPRPDGSPLSGDLGYIKFGVCPADNGHFSITLAVPQIEKQLCHAITDPATFDALSTALPGSARWTNGAHAEPVGPVYAMGDLDSVWRSLIKDGAPQVLNFFLLGDAAIRTNPLYGRGCSAGIVHAFTLRDVVEKNPDPKQRALRFDAGVQAEFRPYYESMARQDLQSIHRAEQKHQGQAKMGLKARLRHSLVSEGLVPAMLGDVGVVRATARAFHMMDPPVRWARRPALLARILLTWMKPRVLKAPSLRPAALGPERGEMLKRLGLA